MANYIIERTEQRESGSGGMCGVAVVVIESLPFIAGYRYR